MHVAVVGCEEAEGRKLRSTGASGAVTKGDAAGQGSARKHTTAVAPDSRTAEAAFKAD